MTWTSKNSSLHEHVGHSFRIHQPGRFLWLVVDHINVSACTVSFSLFEDDDSEGGPSKHVRVRSVALKVISARFEALLLNRTQLQEQSDTENEQIWTDRQNGRLRSRARAQDPIFEAARRWHPCARVERYGFRAAVSVGRLTWCHGRYLYISSKKRERVGKGRRGSGGGGGPHTTVGGHSRRRQR